MTSKAKTERLNQTVSTALAVILAGLYLWSRLRPLDQSLWHDEAVTMLRYVQGGPQAILFGDYIPNNHILFSLLTWLTSSVLGSHEVVLRLWSVLPATAAPVLVAWWLFEVRERWAACTFLVLAVLTPQWVHLVVQARGYGLTLFASALLVVSAARSRESKSWTWILLFGLSAFVGASTLPVFAIPAALAGACLLADRKLWWRVGLSLGAAGVLTFLVYLPVLGDLLNATSQEFGRPLRWYEFLTGPLFHQLFPLARLSLGLPGFSWRPPKDDPLAWVVLAYLLLYALIAAGAYRMWKRDRVMSGLLLATSFGTYLVLTAAQFHMADRFASFTSVPLLLLVACGVAQARDWLKSTPMRIPVFVAAGGLAFLLTTNFVHAAHQYNYAPLQNYKGVVGYLDGFGDRRLLVNTRNTAGFRYYRHGEITWVRRAEQIQSLCDTNEAFLYVDHRRKRLVDRDVECLEERGARRAEIKQRARPPMVVWAWPPE